jgi:hypothetical protein
MKKILLLLFAFIMISNLLYAQDTTSVLSKMQRIPASDEQNKAAQDKIKTALQSGDGSALFETFCILGPQLWKKYQSLDALKNIPEGNVDFKVPLFDQNGNRTGMGVSKGKLMQSAEDFSKAWKQITADLKGDNLQTVQAKDFTNKDRFQYWLLFANKLEEPVFIITCNNRRFLFKTITGSKLFFVEDMDAQ